MKIWDFLRNKDNQQTLQWIGGAISSVAAWMLLQWSIAQPPALEPTSAKTSPKVVVAPAAPLPPPAKTSPKVVVAPAAPLPPPIHPQEDQRIDKIKESENLTHPDEINALNQIKQAEDWGNLASVSDIIYVTGYNNDDKENSYIVEAKFNRKFNISYKNANNNNNQKSYGQISGGTTLSSIHSEFGDWQINEVYPVKKRNYLFVKTTNGWKFQRIFE